MFHNERKLLWYWCFFSCFAWLWSRAWCVSLDQHPTSRASLTQGAWFPWWDTMHISLWPNSQRGCNRLSAGLQHLHGPFCFLDMIIVLCWQTLVGCKVLQMGTHSHFQCLTPVHQFVITGIECKGLHDVGSCPEELPVQPLHWWKRDTAMLQAKLRILLPALHFGSYQLQDVSQMPQESMAQPLLPSSPEQTQSLHHQSPPPQHRSIQEYPVWVEGSIRHTYIVLIKNAEAHIVT